jgi:hypothetical protein
MKIEVGLKRRIVFESKASIRLKSGAYTLVREHFKADRNAAIGHKMGFGSHFYFQPMGS